LKQREYIPTVNYMSTTNMEITPCRQEKKYSPILIILLLVIFSESSLLNGAEERETTRGPTPLQLDPHFKPHLGTSYYTFELNGLDIGTGWISMLRDGNLYKIRYEAKTNEKVDYVYKARYKGEGIMETDPLSLPVLEVL